MNKFKSYLILALLTVTKLSAQFNENLEKEILRLNTEYGLDGIERTNALDRLEEIVPDMEFEGIAENLFGTPWKYSHTVSNTGRKYRQSNATYVYQFDENESGYIMDKEGNKTWLSWDKEKPPFLIVNQYKTANKEENTRSDILGIQLITEDRLVFSKLVKSKNNPDKSAVIFHVYFRR